MAIKDWPESERPRERLLSQGPAALSDAELLAIFLRVGVTGRSALDLAGDLLARFRSINALFGAPREEFVLIKGLGEAKYVQLMAAHELAKRALTEEIRRDTVLNSPGKVRDYLKLRQIIDYCMAKRTSRRDRQISKAAAVGAGVSVFQGIKALHKIRKGTKGVARNANANDLYELAKRGGKVGEIATLVVQYIAGNSFDGLLKNAIKDGMKSTA